jgi:peptidoglycan/xylan/chitin deacetylase (PgdA/CDA1 family)
VIEERSNMVSYPKASSGKRENIMGPRLPGILMYHAIARVAEDPNRICVSPRRFEAQMVHLKRRGLQGVSVRELLRASGTMRARKLVGITFDDGYENFLYDAVPILKRHGFSATVFVVGGMLGAENTWDEGPRMRLLEAEGVREAAKRGMEVASHGMSHIRLAGLPAARLEEEVIESRRVLSELLDETVEGFCYPYGSLDGAAARGARRAGYSYACACWTRVECGIYDLPRAPVWEMDGHSMLAAKLRLFPFYFDLASLPVQNAVDNGVRLLHGGAKYMMHKLGLRKDVREGKRNDRDSIASSAKPGPRHARVADVYDQNQRCKGGNGHGQPGKA